MIDANSVSSTNVVTLNGTAEANSTVTVFDGATQLGTATANASGAWSYSTAALANGSHSFTATDADAAGNTSAASSVLNLTLTAPVIPVNLVANGSFETGDFTGWTLGGNYVLFRQAHRLTSIANLKAVSSPPPWAPWARMATLSQTLQTTAGQQYTLSFWLANQLRARRLHRQMERYDPVGADQCAGAGLHAIHLHSHCNRTDFRPGIRRPPRSVALEFGQHLSDSARYTGGSGAGQRHYE